MTARGRVLIAPDSFKGTFTAAAVAAAIAEGVRSGGLDADVCPVADGGEGTMAVLAPALEARRCPARVHDPLGRRIEARFALSGDGRTAVVEMAEASGLHLVAPDPEVAHAASTTGTGELVVAALRAGAREILLAVGGSATTDGGRGAVEAIGDAGGLAGARLTVLCDVTTPFEDAARIFGPQKGADPQTVAALTQRLHALAATWPRDPRGRPMTGAAGGLAGGLWAALGARLVPGAPAVLDVLGFDERLARADAVVVGEGRIDDQSTRGKIAGEIAARAVRAGIPVHAVVGRDGLSPAHRAAAGIAEVIEAPTLTAMVAAGRQVAAAVRALTPR